MPYRMYKLPNQNKYRVKNIDTGRIHSYATSKADAIKQIRFLHGIDAGYYK